MNSGSILTAASTIALNLGSAHICSSVVIFSCTASAVILSRYDRQVDAQLVCHVPQTLIIQIFQDFPYRLVAYHDCPHTDISKCTALWERPWKTVSVSAGSSLHPPQRVFEFSPEPWVGPYLLGGAHPLVYGQPNLAELLF